MNSNTKDVFLVCVNEKSHSETALKFACAKARQCDAKVRMLYIINPMDYNTLFSVADVIKEDRLNDARKFLEETIEKASSWFDIVPSFNIREGKVMDEIIEEITENSDIALLVLGVAADGSSSKGKLLSQLTNEIGGLYNVPLLIIPGNVTEEQIMALNG